MEHRISGAVIARPFQSTRREGLVASDEAWRRVKPFKNADGVRLRFLSEEEAARLVAACEPDFAALVRGALMTGARYSELARMTVADVNLSAATVYVRESKSNKPRHISLSSAGVAHFRKLIEDETSRDRIFMRSDGREWRASDQVRPMNDAVETAKIDPPITFHGLRDTHASALAMAGVSMKVIAEQLGHADTRTTEKHYAHLAPSARATAVANHLPNLGA